MGHAETRKLQAQKCRRLARNADPATAAALIAMAQEYEAEAALPAQAVSAIEPPGDKGQS